MGLRPPSPGDRPADEDSWGSEKIIPEALTVRQIARMWEEFRLLTRHGPCQNCERMHGALTRLQQVLADRPEERDAASLRSAIQDVRRPAELHPPLGCQPCSTEAALRHGDTAPGSAVSGRGR